MNKSLLVIMLLLLNGQILVAQPVSVELKPVEIRRHWTAADALQDIVLDEETKEKILREGPEASVVMRNWYRDLPSDGKWTAEGTEIGERIVMVDLKVYKLRFMWYATTDYLSGADDYVLTIWRSVDSKDVLELSVNRGLDAQDMSSYVQEGRASLDKGYQPTNSEIIVNFTYGGREWTTTYEDWSKGQLVPVDKSLLDQALDETLLENLKLLDVFAQNTPDLFQMCVYLTHPLLGEYEEPCKLIPGKVNLWAGKPDCTFDAWFGEECSDEQMLESKLRKEPNLTPGGGQ